jgi:peptidoglycan/xylan/chitin deacetylase (PgdA/CDA1 family)
VAGSANVLKKLAALAMSIGVGTFDSVKGLLNRCLGMSVSRRGVVLYYHAVKAHQRSRFARQMDTLLSVARPFPAGSPESMIGHGRHAAVTFDDGFRSVVENAVPELTARGIPFTVFVPTGCLGQRPSWVRGSGHPSSEEQVLSASELRALASLPLATIGSHSVSHPNMLAVAPAQAEQELVRSRLDLQAATGAPVELFSFPHGAHSTPLLEQARRAGYRRVFTIEPSSVSADSGLFAVGRVAADPDDWPLEFRLKIAGAYRWRSHLRRLRPAV